MAEHAAVLSACESHQAEHAAALSATAPLRRRSCHGVSPALVQEPHGRRWIDAIRVYGGAALVSGGSVSGRMFATLRPRVEPHHRPLPCGAGLRIVHRRRLLT